MSTRAQIRFATREEGVTFSEHPEKIHAQFYVHSDGYPEGLGIEIAQSLLNSYKYSAKINNWEIEGLGVTHGDLEYIYYIWQARGKDTWISIFEVGRPSYCEHCNQYTGDKEDNCIFVGTADKLIEKYKQNTNDDG